MKNILVLSGYGCKPWIWNQINNNLTQIYSFEFIDWPSDELHNYDSLDNFVEWLHNKVNSLSKNYECIIGHSMGGLVAIHYVNKYKSTIKDIVLVESFIKTPNTFFQNLIFENNSILESQVNGMLKDESGKYSKKLPDQLRELDLSDIVINLNCSITTIYGDRGCNNLEKVVSELDWNPMLKEQIKIYSVENSCHFPMLENSNGLSEILKSFL